MNVKRIGKARIDLEDELWAVEGKEGKYTVNRRLVDTHPEYKAVRSAFAKEIQRDTPSRRKPVRREQYFKSLEAYQKAVRDCLAKIFGEIREESFERPVLLQKHRDYDHQNQWRYCLYKGMIYMFDKQGYTTDAMRDSIEEFERMRSGSKAG